MVYILLGAGFEEIEAVAPLDILRRGGVPAAFAGVGEKQVKGAHGITLTCDVLLEEIDLDRTDMLVVPGGLGGTQTIRASKAAMALLKRAHERGKLLAAICAGPTVLYELGILDGVRAVCYPGMEAEMPRALAQEPGLAVCREGKLITGRGPGTALSFGFELLRCFRSDEEVEKLKTSMVCR